MKKRTISLLLAALMLLSLFIMEGDWSFLRRKKHT